MPPKQVNTATRATQVLVAQTAPSRTALVLAFFCIYVVWGSTYLGIRYAVETIPPLIVAAVRHIVAGVPLPSWGARSHSRRFRV